jgi:hypothetical protein
MQSSLEIMHWIAGLIGVAEALNKLERTAPFAPGLSAKKRLVDGLKAIAWALLAVGGGGAIASPLLHLGGIPVGALPWLSHQVPTLAETAVLVGFATLIVRTRVKEG